ncbi:uncharacterized protein C1orf198 homolog isoform X1 [Prorops nasuta]|uniref:uncharacterized protein C1orf198 homolog isoform X1 n=1 Tax=Prorops nasuta TaxID=863751 RepID=UPI0034CF8081
MSNAPLTIRAEQYFHSLNPLAKRIGDDITATKEAYEGLWNTLSMAERNQAINETIIQPEVALKYTLQKIEAPRELPDWYPTLRIQTGMKYVIDETGATLRWRDEHSAPFSFMSQSQMNLSLGDGSEEPSKSMRSHFGEPTHYTSTTRTQNDLKEYNLCSQEFRYASDEYSSSIFESEDCSILLKSNSGNDNSDNIFAKLINKTALLKLQGTDDDLENLVPNRDSDSNKSQMTSTVTITTKSTDINESTALLETPSSYNSFQSTQLNQDEEERSIPKTGFEFLDNW